LRIEAALREQQRLLAVSATRLQDASVEDVHHARVAARRLRSLLKTYRPLLDARRARLYRIDLRSYARALAGVREADVRRDMLIALARSEPAVTPVEFQRLRIQLEDHCLAARQALGRHLGEPGWGALQRALERHAVMERLLVHRDADLGRVLDLVDESWRKAVRLLEDVPEEAAGLHELRLALKHCRYALESVSDVSPKSAARLMRRLRAAQDGIGEHRDAVLARHWVKSRERSLGRVLTRRLLTLLDRRDASLRKQAAARSRKVLPSYLAWRKAARRIRRTKTSGRG
jgi:CHAD domain-containing protein